MTVPSASQVSVICDESLTALLDIRSQDDRPVILLRTAGLHTAVLEGWLERTCTRRLSISSLIGGKFPYPLIEVASLVICCDSRTESLAYIYAQSIGSCLLYASSTAELEALLVNARDVQSATLFLLNDALDESICNAIWVANRIRQEAGQPALTFGFMTGFNTELLAWLIAKTLVLLTRLPLGEHVGFADFNGIQSQLSVRFISTIDGSTEEVPDFPTPWMSKTVDVFAGFMHGVSFDAFLGDTALCGHLEPSLPSEHLYSAPSCFFDGKCFRLQGANGPTKVLPSVRATPLLWFLNSCGAIPLAQSAFGTSTGYAFGLLAGSAVGVIGPYITEASNSWRNRVFEGLLATGLTVGQATNALARLNPIETGFYSYVLLGCPDLRIMPIRCFKPLMKNDVAQYIIQGTQCSAIRLSLPVTMPTSVMAVADDQGPTWSDVGYQPISYEDQRDILLLLSPARNVDGWLAIGPSKKSDTELLEQVEEFLRRLKVLKLYSFVHAEASLVEKCQSLLQDIIFMLRSTTLLRRRIYAAILYAQLETAFNDLHEAVGKRFLEEVLVQNFSFDRESYNGFYPGLVTRTKRHCPKCNCVLFTALDRWQEEESYYRRKDVCANCFGVSMFLETSPLEVSPPRVRCVDSQTIEASLQIRNRSSDRVSVWVAAALRRGNPNSAIGPMQIDLRPDEVKQSEFCLTIGQNVGTISIRFIALVQGSAEFHDCLFTFAHPSL
jgi:hypothetical protein